MRASTCAACVGRRRLQATGTEFGAATDNTVSVTAITNAAGTATLGQLVIRPVPDRFKRDAMFQAALQSALEQQASDSGQGLTPAQALAASAATAPRKPDSVTAAAAPGTVVAWLVSGCCSQLSQLADG